MGHRGEIITLFRFDLICCMVLRTPNILSDYFYLQSWNIVFADLNNILCFYHLKLTFYVYLNKNICLLPLLYSEWPITFLLIITTILMFQFKHWQIINYMQRHSSWLVSEMHFFSIFLFSKLKGKHLRPSRLSSFWTYHKANLGIVKEAGNWFLQ